jgi:hypothetical protein
LFIPPFFLRDNFDLKDLSCLHSYDLHCFIYCFGCALNPKYNVFFKLFTLFQVLLIVYPEIQSITKMENLSQPPLAFNLNIHCIMSLIKLIWLHTKAKRKAWKFHKNNSKIGGRRR